MNGDERQLANWIRDVAQEWMNYGEWDSDTPGAAQVRAMWHDDAEGETVHIENRETGHVMRFKVTITAEQLSSEPKRDPDLLNVLNVEWVTRPLRDARAGDRIRLAGRPETEDEVEAIGWIRPWHVHPAADQYHPERMPAEWSDRGIKLKSRPAPLFLPLTTSIEILVTREFLELMSIPDFDWDNRVSGGTS